MHKPTKTVDWVVKLTFNLELKERKMTLQILRDDC
jgi:hypothetical protein